MNRIIPKLILASPFAFLVVGTLAVSACEAPAAAPVTTENSEAATPPSARIAKGVTRVCDKQAGVVLYVVQTVKGVAVTSHPISSLPVRRNGVC